MPKPREARFRPAIVPMGPTDRARLDELHRQLDALGGGFDVIFTPEHQRLRGAINKLLVAHQICTHCEHAPIARARSSFCRECSAHSR